MRFALTIDGEAHEVATKAIDIVTAERKYGSIEAKPVETALYLAWSAATRAGVTTLDFDAFLAHVDDVDEVPEAPLESTSAS